MTDTSPHSPNPPENALASAHAISLILKSINNLVTTAVDPNIPISKQKERIRSRSSDIRRASRKLD